MSVRPICIWPDPALRQETVEVTEFNEELREFYRDMVDTMYAHNGLGLAAIQIGDPRKMFIVEPRLVGLDQEEDPVAFINPEILSTSGDTIKANEGCLSFPGIYVPVERPMRAKVRAANLDGDSFEIDGEELMARCLLHENDHLIGRLLVDYVGPLKKQMIKRKLRRESAQAAAG